MKACRSAPFLFLALILLTFYLAQFPTNRLLSSSSSSSFVRERGNVSQIEKVTPFPLRFLSFPSLSLSLLRRRSTTRGAAGVPAFGGRSVMERKVVAVCAAVGFLGLLSAALAFAAEGTRIKASDVQTTRGGECIYPKSPALALGLISALALMMAQAIINTIAGCICCKKDPNPSSTNWTLGLLSFIASWVSFIIAFLLLLTGAALNDQRGQERMYFGDYCYVVKSGVFAGGGVLSLASVALGIVYYVVLSSENARTWGSQQNQGIAMAYPQAPPQAAPVFVHEDTYSRQQFP